jgi:polysaccharide export outer membrane protein
LGLPALLTRQPTAKTPQGYRSSARQVPLGIDRAWDRDPERPWPMSGLVCPSFECFMRLGLLSILLLGLGACSILPNDGPSSRSIAKGAAQADPHYALVDLTFEVAQRVASEPDVVLAGLSAEESHEPTDRLAAGDVLTISVFEAGAGGLFARPPDMGVNSQATFPKLVVDPGGFLTIPFAGQVHVAGLTPLEAEAAIRQSLRGRAIDPQINLTVTDSRANSVIVLGEVRNSGHVPLTPHNDRLFDAIASAGGPTRPPADLMVFVQRGALSADVPMSVLLARPSDNIRLAPQDQVRVLYRPRRYDIFGALGHITQTVIEDDKQTLASAISRAGGLDTLTANAKSVFIFRFERPAVARALGVTTPPTENGVPIVYRLNLLKPEGFFIANNFEMKPDDLLYVARSDLTQTEKFLNVVNLATQIGYNARVVGVTP